MSALPPQFQDWFTRRGWSVHPHQQQMLDKADAPALMLIAPTGGGKTLAGFLPSLIELSDGQHRGLHTLYVSPLKALASDIKRNLRTPVDEMELPIRIEDEPDFAWRGLMIDTSRHYLPLSVIRRTINSLMYNKMTVLHWHITDEDSFPLEIPGYPDLTKDG